MAEYALRPYQTDALHSLRGRLEQDRSALVVMPTGTGKTQVFVSLLAEWPGRVLVLAHRDELIGQAVTRIEQMTGEIAAVEKADQRGDDERVVVASVQSLRGARLERFERDHFDLVVVDEAHHAPAESYRAITDHFDHAKVAGFTATPDRLDGLAMGKAFNSVAYRYELPDAIADGWLARPLLFRVNLERLDLKRVTVRNGDYAPGELDQTMGSAETLADVAVPLLERSGDRRTVVFMPGVSSAHGLAELLNERSPGIARSIDGSTPADERRSILEAHAAGRFRVLVNCALLTEGYDDPGVSCIAVARPTKSRALYAQMVGRGLRLAPEKADCVVLDFAGATGVHGLVGPEDILGGRRLKTPTGSPVDVLDELEAEAERERKAAFTERGCGEVRYRVKAVAGEPRKVLPQDAQRMVPAPKFWLLIGGSADRWKAHMGVGGRAGTAKQYAALERSGVVALDEIPRHLASRLIGALIDRRSAGLATPKQLALLDRLGALRGHPSIGPQLTFRQASMLISAAKAHGWRPPPASSVESILSHAAS